MISINTRNRVSSHFFMTFSGFSGPFLAQFWPFFRVFGQHFDLFSGSKLIELRTMGSKQSSKLIFWSSKKAMILWMFNFYYFHYTFLDRHNLVIYWYWYSYYVYLIWLSFETVWYGMVGAFLSWLCLDYTSFALSVPLQAQLLSRRAQRLDVQFVGSQTSLTFSLTWW